VIVDASKTGAGKLPTSASNKGLVKKATEKKDAVKKPLAKKVAAKPDGLFT